MANVGAITVQQGNTLTEQIQHDEIRTKLQQQILALQKRLNKEKQYNRQIEINAEIKQLKKQLNDIK